MFWIFLEVIYFIAPKQTALCMLFIGMYYCNNNSNNLQSFLIYHVPGAKLIFLHVFVYLTHISSVRCCYYPLFMK